MCHQFVMIPKEIMLEMMQHKDIDFQKAKELSREIEKNALRNQENRIKTKMDGDFFEPESELVFAEDDDLYRAMADSGF
jgi:hypothetical protein